MQSNDDSDRLECLQTPNDASHGAQDARLLAAGRGLGRRRGPREETAVAGSLGTEVVRAELAVESLGGAAHERLPEEDGRVGKQVPRRGIVGAVQDHVVGSAQ